MPSSVDEQPPGSDQPPSRDRPRPQPARRRPPPRGRSAGPRRRPPAPAARQDEPDDERPARGGKTRGPSRKLIVLLTVLSLVVVGLGVFGVVLSSRSSSTKLPPAADPATPVPVTTFHDDLTGTSVEYPRSWQKIAVPVADYRLAVDGGSNVAFTIRVVPIETPATAANLENFKAVTDGLVTSNPSVQILKQQAVSLNGMLGYYYFYTFTDGGVSAVHAHYFLFSGNKMNILVFQALPDDFQGMAATFDKIAESFRSDPNVPPTTVAPASTTSTTAG
jgi:hypothetical protein